MNSIKIKKILKLLLKVLLFPIIFTITYFIFAVILTIIPIGDEFQKDGSIEIYLSSNGLHADFIVPFKNEIIDWNKFIDPKEYSAFQNETPKFISFGWGDKGFYLSAARWEDIPLKIQFKALFWKSESVMHVSLWPGKPLEYSNTVKFLITEEQYKILIKSFINSFQLKENLPQLIPDKGYSKYDNFYEAKGSYTLFYTCNTWVNELLKDINVKTSLWTPFEQGIFYHFD